MNNKTTAKLYFYYAAMEAGKTTSLLQQDYIYRKKNIQTFVFIPKISNKDGYIKSRIGIEKKGIAIS
ncbi:MAG: thymidine kinase, partial [Enterobacteriaceae bacterium]|nr:thymidine kinase [Enterobacteriaceae bacterium]